MTDPPPDPLASPLRPPASGANANAGPGAEARPPATVGAARTADLPGRGLPGPADAPLPGGAPEAVAAWPLRPTADTPPAATSSAAMPAWSVHERKAPEETAAPPGAPVPEAERRGRRGAVAALFVAMAGVGVYAAVTRTAPVPRPAPVAREPVAPPSPEPVATGRVGFRLTTARVTGTDHALHTLVGMPGETIPLRLDGVASPVLTTSDGRLDRTGDGWAWTLPATPGLARLTVADGTGGATQQVQALVMTPYDGSGRIDGYEIGTYADDPDPTRPRPRGFVALPPSMEDVPVSAHFRLGDFACKQPGNPRYLMLDERLLVKLETLLVRVRAEGIAASRFVVMSGYRTPHYNASIGNETSRSAHLYGQAADIYIDENGDGSMDDLTGDGQVTRADAERLAEIASPLDDDPRFVGGLGIYSPAPHRGPFIHVDTRGRRSRW